MKTAWLVPVLVAVCGAYPGNIGPGALSGVPGLPLSDVLEDGNLRFRSGFEYARRDGIGNSYSVPLAVCRGFSGGYEAGVALPVYLSDDSHDGMSLGDITLSGALLYETTRGGTAIKFSGSVFLPTGEEGRDPGAGAGIGAVTSTTFRLFRFSASGQYRLVGGQKPSRARWNDSMAFAFGGMSFVEERMTLFTSLSGDSDGALKLQAGASLEPWRALVIDCSVMADMAEHGSYGVFLGASWTVEGL